MTSGLVRGTLLLLAVYFGLWLAFTGWIKKAYGPRWYFVSYSTAIAASLVQVVCVVFWADRMATAGVSELAGIDIFVWAAVLLFAWALPGAWVWFDVMKRANPALGFPVGLPFAMTGALGAVAWYFLRGRVEGFLSAWVRVEQPAG